MFRIPLQKRTLLRPLMPHQTEALLYATRTIHPAILLEMRLGKTLVAIRWAQSILARTCVVVGPLDVLHSWEAELTREGELYSRCYELRTEAKRIEAIRQVWESKCRRWLLVNYESELAMGEIYAQKGDRSETGRIVKKTRRELPIFTAFPWDIVILDESTRIRNPQTQTTKLNLDGFRLAKHRAILTGLIDPESYLDVFCQFCFLDGEFMGYVNFWEFRAKMFHKVWGHEWRPRKGVRAAIRTAVHARAFVKTRAQAGMPDRKVLETRHVRMSPAQKDLYEQVKSEWQAECSNVLMVTKYAMVRELWLQKIAGGYAPNNEPLSPNKQMAIIELLRGELQGQQVVIWAAFRHEVMGIYEALKKAKIPATYIHGKDATMTAHERVRRVEACRRGEFRALVATEQVAQFGNDYSFADTAIYHSNALSCQARAQSEDRLIHPQKTTPVLILDVMSEGSCDIPIRQLVKSKHLEARLLQIQFRQFLQRS